MREHVTDIGNAWQVEICSRQAVASPSISMRLSSCLKHQTSINSGKLKWVSIQSERNTELAMIGHWLDLAMQPKEQSLKTHAFYLGSIFHFQTPKWTISRATSHFQPNFGICFSGSHLIRISRLLCSSAMDISATVKRWRRPETLGVEQRYASLCVAGQDLIPWGYSIGYTVVREIWWEWTKNLIFINCIKLSCYLPNGGVA